MESITGGTPKSSGFSKKAIVVGGAILGVLVLAILVALHNKAKQQDNQKKKTSVTSVMTSVVGGVAKQSSVKEDDLTAVPKQNAVPDFVENVSSAREEVAPVKKISAYANKTQTDEDKAQKMAVHSSLIMEDQGGNLKDASKPEDEKKKQAYDDEKATQAVMDAIKNTGSQKIPSMAEIQKAIDSGLNQNRLAMPQMASAGGGGESGGSPAPGFGMGGIGGMGGYAMPTVSPTNPSPDKMSAAEVKWQNSQDKGEKPGILTTQMFKPATNYFLTAGDIIPAVLTREIKTSTPGTAEAMVSHDIYNDAPGHENEILIPANSTLVGTYNSSVNFGQTRVQVVWKEVHLPNGAIVMINGEGSDMSGANGFHDKVNNHYMKIVGAVALMSLFDVGPMLATPSSTTSQLTGGGVESMYGQSLGMNASQFGMQYASNAMNIAPTITIENAYTFNVVLPKTVVFDSYYSVIGSKK